MSLKKSPAEPQAPDPQVTANAQTASNVKTAVANADLNRINQITPQGTLTYEKTTNATPVSFDKDAYAAALKNWGETSLEAQKLGLPWDKVPVPDANDFKIGGELPQYTQVIKLSPEQQRLYDMTTQGQTVLGQSALGMADRIKGQYGSELDLSGAPGLASRVSDQDYAQQLKQAQDAIYGKQTAFLDPQFKQDQALLESKLINQGLMPGTEAYTNAMGDFNRAKEFSYGQARDSAVQMGNALQNQLFNQKLSGANLSNAARSQFLQEAFAKRGQPLNEFSALLNGSQVSNPLFNSVPVTGVANTDTMAPTMAAYQGQLNQYNQKIGRQNATTSAIGQLGGMAAMAAISDIRLKKDITPMGSTSTGIPTYTFRYNNESDDAPLRFGVMAQDVEKIIPEAVITRDDGFKMVNYAMVG